MSFARWSRRFYSKSQEKSNPVISIIGIDPGSRACGYGIINTDGMKSIYVASGKIVLDPKDSLHKRLRELHEGISEVIIEYKPVEAVVEKVFFAKSAMSALSLGQARGVALFTVSKMGLDVFEYSALEVKKAVTGYGRAEKKQVQEMVRNLLKINHNISTDSADALALALCRMSRTAIDNAVGLKYYRKKINMRLYKPETKTK